MKVGDLVKLLDDPEVHRNNGEIPPDALGIVSAWIPVQRWKQAVCWRLSVKVGDLVELSAYGKSLTCNYNQRGRLGLVLEVDAPLRPTHLGTAVTVQWSGNEVPSHQVRRDLKHRK